MKLPEIDKVFFVHYQCDDFDEGNKISSLSVHANNRTKEFKGIESEAIKDYCKYVNELKKKKLKLVHWNQDRPHYGPDHIKSRYFEICKDRIEIDHTNDLNLSYELVKVYGDDYIEHPRLDKLAALNGFSGIRSDKRSPTIFPTERVLLLAKIYLNHQKGILKTQNRILSDERGLRLELEKYEFLNLISIKKFSEENIKSLLIEINNSKVSKQIAWFSFLGFIEHLDLNYCKGFSGKRNQVLANIIHCNSDTVKKEINSLVNKKTNKRYFAKKYLPEVKKAYENLK